MPKDLRKKIKPCCVSLLPPPSAAAKIYGTLPKHYAAVRIIKTYVH
jgi:hypothetical protein